MNKKEKIIIIGGVAAGPKAAARITRLNNDAEVIVIEKGEFLSYAGCGLPYYVSGVVKEQAELMSTPIGVVRDPAFFEKVKNVKVLNNTLATEIDVKNKTVGICKADEKSPSEWLKYDKLILCTGATPVVPPIKGIEKNNIFTLHGVEDAEGVKSKISGEKAMDCVIVGGGLIGVEMTEALVERGCRVTIIERLPHILSFLDDEMARQVELHMEAKGVKVMTNTTVTAFTGEDSVTGVETDNGCVSAEIVIMAIGVRPRVELAKNIGLEIGTLGGIVVDEKMCTSIPDIYAAGDCVENINIITGKSCYAPLGSTANKHGRVAASNICGLNDKFNGVLGSAICKVFDFNVGRTGLSEDEALKAGYEVETVLSPSPDKAHFMPDAKLIMLKMVVDKANRCLLGLQAVGPGSCDKKIDIAAMALTAKMTIDQLAEVDLCYAPPFSPAMDNIITASNIVRNKLDGLMNGITPAEVNKWREEKRDFTLLDVRSKGEYDEKHIEGSLHIPLGALRTKVDEIPKDKPVVAFCKISLRGYEAALILKSAGFKDISVMDGGIVMWSFN